MYEVCTVYCTLLGRCVCLACGVWFLTNEATYFAKHVSNPEYNRQTVGEKHAPILKSCFMNQFSLIRTQGMEHTWHQVMRYICVTAALFSAAPIACAGVLGALPVHTYRCQVTSQIIITFVFVIIYSAAKRHYFRRPTNCRPTPSLPLSPLPRRHPHCSHTAPSPLVVSRPP